MDLLKKTLTETRRKNTLLIMQLKQLQQSMFELNHVTVLENNLMRETNAIGKSYNRTWKLGGYTYTYHRILLTAV